MISWDFDLLHRINREWTSPFLDYLMPALSAIDAWIPFLAIIVIITAVRGGKRARLMLLCIAVAVGFADGVVCKSLKSAVGRVRPRDSMSGVVIRDLAPGKPAVVRLFKSPVSKVSTTPEDKDARGKSFPSSHVANMFALATVVALFFQGWGLVAFVVAALVAYSRVYVGAHWPSDIPPSAGIGMFIGWATVRIASAIARKYERRTV
jgi:undecaprenyl-diphosphatase